MPTMSVRLRSFLESHGVAYETIHHRPKYTAQEIAADTHTPGREFAKTVILMVDRDYAMAILPAHHMVDCEKVSQALGGREVRLACEDEIRDLIREHCPDCELGAIPPFGNLYGLSVYVSVAMTEDEHVTFNAGTHVDVIRMGYLDFEKLVQPRLMAFSKYVESAPRQHREK